MPHAIIPARADAGCAPPARRAVRATHLALSGLVLFSAACASSRGPSSTVGETGAPAPELPGERSATLPDIPSVTGPIRIRVQHPPEGALLAVDSTFVFGTVGSGDAQLRINGVSVPVAPNGAFLAFLAVPNGPAPAYAFEAARRTATPSAADSSRFVRAVRRPTRVPLSATGVLQVDSASLAPRGTMRMRSDELVRLSIRAPSNATVWLRTGDQRTVPMVRASDIAQTTAQSAGRAPVPLVDAGSDVGTTFVGEARASQLTSAARVVIARNADTVRVAPIVPELISPLAPPRYGVLRNRTPGLVAQSDTDRVVNARPIPDGFSKWALLPGTQLEITGHQGTQTRVRFDSQLETWVPTADLLPLPEGAPAPVRLVGGMRVLPAAEWVDVIIPTGVRPAFLVEPDDATLSVILYDTKLSPDISPMIGNDPLVRQLAWEPLATDRTRLDVRLSAPVYGWLAFWDDARRALVLRVRRVPRINPERPLEGLTLVVDAGHPPGGATGPTGLTEADAVLPIAQQLARLLESRGARVVMTRSTPETVALTDRPVLARRANAHAFLSVHLNAFGDGTNPFVNHGTSTLFFHQPSEPLAREVQRFIMREIGQRDIGVHYQSLAIARPTWFPSALAEGLFLMFPDQEAAMRRVDWQERYARGIADGATEYFRRLGARTAAMAARP